MATVLLVVDLQVAMFSAAIPPHDGEAMRARVAGLIARARSERVPILHIRHDGGAGDPLERGTPGWSIHADVEPRDDEPVIDKTRCSAFNGTDLHARLKALGARRLVITGMQTEYCIDTLCRAAHGLGYTVTLIRDGHSTFATEDLPAAAIVAHHNRALYQGGFVALADADMVVFGP